MSIVIPRSRSAFSLSRTQAYLNDPFPSSAASFSNYKKYQSYSTEKTHLLDGSLVDTTAFVDEMSSSSGLAGIDVADNDTRRKRVSVTSKGGQKRYKGRRDTYTLTCVFSLPMMNDYVEMN